MLQISNMINELEPENNIDLEDEGIEIIEEDDDNNIPTPDSNFYEEKDTLDDSSELGLGEDPDDEDDVDFDTDDVDLM